MSDLGMWIETSAYSQSGLSLEEVDEDYDEMEDDERPDAEETDARKFVILSSDNLDR
jgi:Tfp pilus assembly PilM family ATPase